MKKLKILGISGSLRRASYNRKALQIAKKICRDFGAEVKEADLKKLKLPIYDQDIEDRAFPKSVLTLKEKVEAADILLIASPEYNHSISGALKNAIDWLSRGKNSLDGKFAVVFGASPGKFGTMRGQKHLREILDALNVFVLPQPKVFISRADKAFDKKEDFKDKNLHLRLEKLIQKTIKRQNCKI